MSAHDYSHRARDGFISALSAGFFLILVGILFIVMPNFFDRLVTFFTHFENVQVPHFVGIFLPAPAHPAAHGTIYSAAAQFSLAWGLFLVGILAVRIFAHSPLSKKAENVSDIVFWLVASYLIREFLNDRTTIELWFAFWAVIIMLIGMTFIIRAAVLAVFGMRK